MVILIGMPLYLFKVYQVVTFFILEGSHLSGGSEDRAPAAMARAITVHADTMKVMYFA